MKTFKFNFLVLFIVSFFYSNAQVSDDGPDFYTITSEMDDYYDSIKSVTPDSVKIQGLKSYERWRDFWQTRVNNDESVQGSFTQYIQNIYNYSKNPAILPTENTSFNWSYTGPGDLNTHNKGIIVSLYIDPAHRQWSDEYTQSIVNK